MRSLAKYYRRPPDQLGADELQAYLLHLIVDKKLAYASVNQAACANPRNRTLLMTTYAAGLRVSEVCALQLADIESAPDRMCIKVRQGKGGKDRYTLFKSLNVAFGSATAACLKKQDDRFQTISTLVVEFRRFLPWLAAPVCNGPLSCHQRRTAADPLQSSALQGSGRLA